MSLLQYKLRFKLPKHLSAMPSVVPFQLSLYLELCSQSAGLDRSWRRLCHPLYMQQKSDKQALVNCLTERGRV